MKQRIYVVRHKHDSKRRWLVRAPSRATAVNYVAARDFEAELAEQDTLVNMLQGGHQIEEARETQGDLPMDGQEEAA